MLIACGDARPGKAAAGGDGAGAAGGTSATGGTGANSGSGAASVGGHGGEGGEGGSIAPPAPDFRGVAGVDLPSPATGSSKFGDAVDVHGDRLLVGARLDSSQGPQSGAAYVFNQRGRDWAFLSQLLFPMPTNGLQQFGAAVAVREGALVVGAPSEGNSTGAAGAFLPSGSTTWIPHKLLSTSPSGFGYFGHAVDISGFHVVVGQPHIHAEQNGSAYVFDMQDESPTPFALAPSDTAARNFGYSVAIDQDSLVIGARGNQALFGTSDPGMAFVYVRDGASWTEQDKLVPSNGAIKFGASVALEGDLAVVGMDDLDDNGQPGVVFFFERTNGTWTAVDQVSASDASAGDRFGASISLDGNALLIGAPGTDDAGSKSGAAYVFERVNGQWIEQTKLVRPGASAEERFGASVSLSGKTAVVGAVNEQNQGTVTVFTAP